MQVNSRSCQANNNFCQASHDQRTLATRLSYDHMAVFPVVKPRSCLNVKFRWTMIRTLRSNFPANRPGVTRWVRPRFPQDGVITLQLPREDANRSSTTDESRVQLMSLEWDKFRLATHSAETTAVQGGTERTFTSQPSRQVRQSLPG